MTIDTTDPGPAMVAALTGRWRRNPPDRALLARLRRAAGRRFGEDETAVAALFEVLPAPGEGPYPSRVVEDAHLVATLFALHPPVADGDEAKAPRSIGATLLRIAQTRDAEAAAARHLGALLASDREDLPWHLRRATTLARAKSVAVDYHALWRDLRRWSYDDRPAQRRWALDFYNAPHPAAGPDATTQEASR